MVNPFVDRLWSEWVFDFLLAGLTLEDAMKMAYKVKGDNLDVPVSNG